jgi:hypothetical protein
MKRVLQVLFATILLSMLGITIYASLHKPLWLASPEFSWQSSPWAVATLFDAYFAFLTFFVWVCFRETTWAARAVWFVLIMSLGNIAMSAYVLLQLRRLKPGEPASNVMRRERL